MTDPSFVVLPFTWQSVKVKKNFSHPGFFILVTECKLLAIYNMDKSSEKVPTNSWELFSYVSNPQSWKDFFTKTPCVRSSEYVCFKI